MDKMGHRTSNGLQKWLSDSTPVCLGLVMCKQDDAPDPVINACNGKK
ncbi:hypothetical protein LINPERPRIM_LOCUS22220 [Linum perenne]